jgi:hypothetical protein
VHVLKKYGGENQASILIMERVLSRKDLMVAFSKDTVARRIWKDVVFGDLMREWAAIFKSAHDAVESLSWAISRTLVGSLGREIACNKLAWVCRGVYKDVLESGLDISIESVSTATMRGGGGRSIINEALDEDGNLQPLR